MLNRRGITESEISGLKKAARAIERLIKESSEKDNSFIINGVEVDGDAFTDAVLRGGLGNQNDFIKALIDSGIFKGRKGADAVLDAIKNLVVYSDLDEYNFCAESDLTDEDIDNGFGEGLVRLKDDFGYAKIWD